MTHSDKVMNDTFWIGVYPYAVKLSGLVPSPLREKVRMRGI
jgi:hypothetical protein